jgi:SAM-dependent methyltransferase
MDFPLRGEPAVSARTLAHYEANAAAFWEGTKDHDVTQNYAAFLGPIEGPQPFAILDFGCGPGRDLAYFRSLGHEAVGLEGCPTFCAMARQHSGCEVIEQDFLSVSLPEGRFDGVFANASLFHVPSHDLLRVLDVLRGSLKPRGVLFSSNPRGQNDEGWHGDRYGCHWEIEAWRALVASAGFDELAHYYRPTGKPRDQQPWLATVWRKSASRAGLRPLL